MKNKALLEYLRCADLPDEAIQLKSFLVWHNGVFDRFRKRLLEQRERTEK